MVVLASDTSIVFRRGCGRGHLTITLKKTAAIYFFWGNKAMFCGREKIFPRSRCDFFASSANHIVKADLTHGRLTPKISTTIFSLSQPWIYQRLRIDLSRSSATTKSSFTKRVILIPPAKTTSRIWSRKSWCSFGRRFLWKAFPRSNPAYVLRRNWEVWARGRNSSTRSINEKFKRKIQTKNSNKKPYHDWRCDAASMLLVLRLSSCPCEALFFITSGRVLLCTEKRAASYTWEWMRSVRHDAKEWYGNERWWNGLSTRGNASSIGICRTNYTSDAPCEKSVSTSVGDETKTYQNVVPSSIRDDESLWKVLLHCSRNFYYLECGMIIPHYRCENVRLLRCVMAELSFRTP